MSREIKKEYLQKVQGGREHVTFRGLLAMAWEEWGENFSIQTELIQAPSEQNGNMAIAKSTLTIRLENNMAQVFVEHGDADDVNTSRNIAPHKVRMSMTRASGRALRLGLNIGEATAEEMGGEDDHEGQNRSQQNSQSRPERPNRGKDETATAEGGDADGEPFIDDNQEKAIRALCAKLDAEGEEAGVRKLEENFGYPIKMMSQSRASEVIEALNKRLHSRSKGRAK